MPGRNEQYNEQLNIIRENQRAGKDNSPEFTRLNTALGKVNEAMTRLSQPGVQMTGAAIGELRALYTEAAIAADNYIKHLPTWVPDRWRSEEGLKRQVGVSRLREFITQDMEALDLYRTNNPMGLEDFLRDARQQVFQAPEHMQSVGNVMSSRNVIEANGMKGVFTENTNVMDTKSVFGFAVSRVTTHLPQNSGDKKYLDELNRLNNAHSTLRGLRGSLSSDDYTKVAAGLKGLNLSSEKVPEDTQQKIRGIGEKLRREGCPYRLILDNDDSKTATPDDLAFTIALGEVMASADKIYSANGVLKSDLHVEKDSSVGDRNTAMSIVSDLIYKPDLLARSSDMKMKLNNGTTISGCYMEWAPGTEIGRKMMSQVTGSSAEKKNARLVFDTPEMVKEAGDMLTIDYICGNIDRHMGNFYVSMEKGENGVYRVTKMTGIDNDQSFPVVGPDELRELGGYYPYIRNAEDFACMKKSTADAVLALSKEKLTFALRHKLTEKEINSAWERTKFLQDQIREGMKQEWEHEDEIRPGKIHVIADDSKAWDVLTLSKVAKLAPQNSFYAQLHRKFVASAVPAFEQLRENAVKEADKGAFTQEYQAMLDAKDPRALTNGNWVQQKLANSALNNEMRIQDLEENEKRVDPDGMLPILPHASQMNLSFTKAADSKTPILEKDKMYQVYHTRRNLSKQTMEYANRALRNLEAEQMGGFFAPGYENHSVVKAAGMEEPNNRYFIDGEPAEAYARRKYWSRDIDARYKTLQDADDKKQFMKEFVSAQILGAMTSGRHHVDMVCITRGQNGRLDPVAYEVNLNLGPADTNGRQKRIDKLAKDADSRENRQIDISNEIGRRINAKMKDGTLNNYNRNVKAWRNAQNAAPQGNQINPNRIEPVAFGELDIQRPRRNAVHRNDNSMQPAQLENQQKKHKK